MAPLSIVETFDVIKDIRPGFVSRKVATEVHPLSLHYAEEALDNSIIVAVSPPAHAAFDAIAL